MKKSRKKIEELKINDLILKQREIFLYDEVSDASILRLIKEIKVLDNINHKPIKLYINSGGGSTTCGLALINVMQEVKSKIITIINTEACSMASQISVAGNERYIVSNGFWMAHDMSGGITGDYSGKVKYRAEFLERHFKVLEDSYKQFTKLTNKDLEIARNGELWLDAKQCLAKGIVDKILK